MTDQPPAEGKQTAEVPEPRITVVGVGGAGGNAIDNMIRANLEGVEFVVANTDAQALEQSLCDTQIQLGATLTKGLGAGANPEIGQAAAEETVDAMVDALKGSTMAFITAGMGGGTGTGGAPVIARLAREEGVLTVGVVTKPFQFEGAHRMRLAEAGIAELAQYVDTLIVIPNQNLFLIADDKTTFADAFRMADEVLHSGVRGVTDLIVMPGLVNLDFADVRAIMAGMGKAVMGSGEAEGDNRALEAAEAAISNPLLDNVSMKGARRLLINITGGLDLMLAEVDEAANRIREEVDPDANIIFGSAFSEALNGRIRVSVIATGSDAMGSAKAAPETSTPFVRQPAEDENKQRAVPIRATVSAESVMPVELELPREDPLTLRLVSSEPASDKEVPVQAEQAAAASAVEPTRAAASASSTQAATDPNPMGSSNPATALPSDPDTAETAHTGLKRIFHRPVTPVKSESTHEAVEAERRRMETGEGDESKTHYVVWENDLGARIYKVPGAKVASVRQEPDADRMKLYDDLETAKLEVDAIFKRISAERTAKGLTRSILEPLLEDMRTWDENNVPDYFLQTRP